MWLDVNIMDGKIAMRWKTNEKKDLALFRIKKDRLLKRHVNTKNPRKDESMEGRGWSDELYCLERRKVETK